MLRYFAKHPVAANLMMLCIFLAGGWAIYKLNAQFLPRFDLNYVTVQVVWPDANTEDVEQLLLIPIQREMRGISNLKRMTGTARQGSARVVLEFKTGTDMVLATEQVKSRVSLAEPLPDTSETPVVTRIERFEPVADVLIYGNVPFPRLKEAAYRYEQQLLAQGIDKVNITGIPEQELLIKVPSTNLLARQQTLAEIGSAIKNNNPQQPVGEVGKANNQQTIRVSRHANLVAEYQNILIEAPQSKQTVRLEDIAEITQEAKSEETKLLFDGQPAINLKLMRSDLGDSLEAAKILRNWYQALPENQQLHVDVKIHNERWQLIQQRITLLIKNGATGLLFILFILFVFLHQRLAFWIAIGIPISILASLALLYLVGGSINMITLFAMIMSLGIIVDDTIVVGENALTQYRNGMKPLDAAVASAKRMAPPVIASSLTTVAAFMPLLVIGGIIGQILSFIPFMVICIIVASLFECFFILPAHMKHAMQHIPMVNKACWRQKVDHHFGRFRTWMSGHIQETALKRPFLPIAASLGCFACAITLLAGGWLHFTFFPTPDGNQIVMNASFKAGTSTEQTKRQLIAAEKALSQVDQVALDRDGNRIIVLSQAVAGSTADTQRDQSQQRGERHGHINVELVDADQREISNQEFVSLWQQHMPELKNIESLEITSIRGGPPGRDVDIQISGLEPSTLKQLAEKLKAHLNTLPGVKNIKDDLPYGKPTIELKPYWPLLTIDLSLAEVTKQLQAGLSGIIIQRLQRNREEIDVVIELPDAEQDDLGLLDYYPIKTPTGKMQNFSDLVTEHATQGFDEIKHDMGERSIHVTAEVDADINNSTAILSAMRQGILAEMQQQYPNLQVYFEGRARDQRETLSDMKLGAFIAMTLIYFILVMVFSSYSWPAVLLFTLPLASTGSIVGHWLLGYDLTILSLFGIFGLTGIIANDGIVLLSYCKEQLAKGVSLEQALHDTLADRFRAVFLTSITTIVGLSPLLFERSLQAQFLIPMAISITFGLAFGFFLVLFLLPSLVVLHYRVGKLFHFLINAIEA